MSRANDFSRGVLFWALGWRHIFASRHLLTLAVVPLLIATAGAGFLLVALWNHLPLWLGDLVLRWIGEGQGFWHDLLYYPLLISAGLLTFVMSIYTIYILQSLIAIPFYSLLAERTLESMQKRPKGGGWGRALAMLKSGAVKSIALLLLGPLLFVLSFVPVLNLLAVSAAMLLLAFDSMDYSFETLGWGLRQRLRYLRREWVQWSGMAAGLALTLLLPGLTLLVIPGAVVGAAMLVKAETQPGN